MPFLVVLVRPQARIITYYASLNTDTAWRIVPSSALLPWTVGGTDSFQVPFVQTGQVFRDAAGRVWLYGYLDDGSDLWACTWDFATEVAVPQWGTVSGTVFGIVSATGDGGAGLYAATEVVAAGAFSLPAAWVVHYPGTGSTASATTTNHDTWVNAFDVGSFPTIPRYQAGKVYTLWTQGGTVYALIRGRYVNAFYAGSGGQSVPSLWQSSGDPTAAGSWSLVQYLSHYDLTSSMDSFGNVFEENLPWSQVQRLGSDVFFTTGIEVIGGASAAPDDSTVVWRMDSGGTVTSDLQMPAPASGDDSWGGPIAVYSGDLYWAQFTYPNGYTYATDDGTVTLWQRSGGSWSVVSTETRPLSGNVYYPAIATMVASPTGLWLLFDPKDTWFTGAGADPTPTLWAWDAGTNTWGVGPSISGGGSQSTPRIWSN